MWMKEAEESVPEWYDGRKTEPAIASFGDGRGPSAEEHRQPLAAGKDKKTDSFLKILERKAGLLIS